MARKSNGGNRQTVNGTVTDQQPDHGDTGQNVGIGASGDSNDHSNGTVIAPDTIAGAGESGNNGDGQPRRKRGRPAGSTSRAGTSKDKLALADVLASGLFLGHVALASSLKAPGLIIDEAEADKLAAAIDKVMAHYIAFDVDARTRDWFNLAIVAGGIYGPRVFRAMNEKKPTPTEPKPAPTELKATVPTTQKVKIPGVPGEHEVLVQ